MPPEEKKSQDPSIAEQTPKPSVIQTYASDMAKAVRENQGSVVKIAMAEAEKREHEYVEFSPKSTKNKIFIISAGALILVGIAIAVYVTIIKASKAVVVPTENGSISLVFSETNKEVPIGGLSRDQIIGSIRNEFINSPLKLGTVENIYFTKITDEKNETKVRINAPDFLSLINSQIPGTLSRTLEPDFMIGAYSWNGTSPFVILKVPNFQIGFSGMLAWEGKLFDDFYKLFNISTEGTNTMLFNKKFTDAVVKNKDSRVLYDDAGKIALMYLFLDDNTILITKDGGAIDEVNSRFLLQKK